MQKRSSAARTAARIRNEIRLENEHNTAFISMQRINLGTVNSDPYLKGDSTSIKGWLVLLAIMVIVGAVFGPVFAKMF